MKLFPLSRCSAAFIGLGLAVVLFVSVNVVADRSLANIRVDLTQNKLYTLSHGTLATLKKIREPIVLRFYYSRKLGDEIPSYGVYAQQVREMLEEYVAASKGKIELEQFDPQPFSATEDRALAFGLQGVPLDQSGEQVYFGLAATNSTDDQQVIPFFQPDRARFLEYDLTKLIHSLSFPTKPVIGLITDLPLEGDVMAAMQGQPMIPYAVIDQIKPLYTVKDLSDDIDAIPPDVNVLMIAHPQHLTQKALYAIDQYVLKGGKALVFVDPYSETQQEHPSQLNPPGSPLNSNLEPLFKSWGIEMVPGMVAGDMHAAREVNAGTEKQVVAMNYVAWLSLDKNNLNRTNLITADLSHINMATAGILEPLKGAKTSFTPLISTSTDSEEIPVAKVQGMPDIGALLRGFKPDDKKLVMAAEVTGLAKTAFPDGPPQDQKKKATTGTAAKPNTTAMAQKAAPAKSAPPAAPEVKASAKPINVVVVADTDILDDRFWVQTQNFFGQTVTIPFANNGDFVANALGVLAGGDDLISLRSRGTSARPFTLIDNIQRAADARYQATEQGLESKLKATEQKMKDLRDQGGSPDVPLATAQEKAINNFRIDVINIRRQLRQVQLALRQDIDRLEAWTEFFDIAFIPILVGITAIGLGVVRMRRRRRHANLGA